MRIVVSDYSGHPFQVQLARALAQRGNDVLHISAASFQTPKGRLEASAADATSFRSVAVHTRRPFAKQTFFRRRGQEIELGKAIAAEIVAFAPDVVLSSNAPLDAQRHIMDAARRADARFVFWVQDLYGEAIRRILTAKIPVIGNVIGRYYQRLEGRMLRRSDHVVVIARDFVDIVKSASGLSDSRIDVIENWAPLDEMPSALRDNDWSSANLPASAFRVIYSGTLGFKHNPALLEAAAQAVDGDVLVFSEGPAANTLRAASEQGLANLSVRDWLPFDDLPKALASADVLVVILEKDAGVFSVPSKVLTYMCVGRPIVAAVPANNLAARLIRDTRAGLVCEPDDVVGFVAAIEQLRADPAARQAMGAAARAYAERTFAIEPIAARFDDMARSIIR